MVTRELPASAGADAGQLPSQERPRLDRGSRVYAVGDVHGHSDKLFALHKAIRGDLRQSPAAKPLLVHLGDYIDRGPDSAGCVSMLALGQGLPGVPTVNLLGNHEAMLLTALAGRSSQAVQTWLDNGGDLALESWGIPADMPPRRWPEMIPPAHLAFLRDLGLTHVQGSYAFVHAGVRPGIRLADQRPVDLLWIRQEFLNWGGAMLPEDPGLMIVHGHTPGPEPVVRGNRIGVDTGAGKGGPLTCAVLDSGPLRFIAV